MPWYHHDPPWEKAIKFNFCWSPSFHPFRCPLRTLHNYNDTAKDDVFLTAWNAAMQHKNCPQMSLLQTWWKVANMVIELEILLIVPSSWILYFNLHQIAVIVETLSRSYFSKTLPTECWTSAWNKSGFDNNKRWISKCGFWNKYFSRPLPVNKRTSISHRSCRWVFKGSRPW